MELVGDASQQGQQGPQQAASQMGTFEWSAQSPMEVASRGASLPTPVEVASQVAQSTGLDAAVLASGRL